MNKWETCAVPDSFVKNKVGRQNQIPAKDIVEFGKFPVIDQGQEFVAGYCDDVSKLINFDLPLIVFGDHTRCFKFVDFPFILGADGTRVLLPNKKLYDPKFYYFALLAIELPSRGYNRHFKSLKERSLPLPPLSEQKKIAHVLSIVQRVIKAQERIIQTTIELKKALMQKLFTEGLRNEPQKQTEIGPVPNSWEVKKVRDVAILKSGGTPSRKEAEFWEDGTIPWVKTGEVDYCTILNTDENITEAGLDNSSAKLFPAGTLLMAMYGQGITRGKVAILGIEATTNQACAAIFPNQGIKTKYLYFFLEHHYDAIRNFAHGANQKNLSADIIKSFPVSYPEDINDQNQIVCVLLVLEHANRVHHKKMSIYQDLFRTLLHELMTANIRINDFDFPELRN